MDAELAALEANNTWQLIDWPPGKVPIDCKYVYKIKYHSNGSVERLKAHLVAKGYTQLEWVDYHETFSLVAKLVTVRCLLAITSVKGWHLYQFDVNNTFLHRDLHEDIYMKKPPGYTKRTPTQVCKLLKILYGLKQASRQWYSKVFQSLLESGFSQSKANYSLFTKENNGSFTALLVYVDDILVVSNDIDSVSQLKVFLDSKFKIKDLCSLRYFLGIEIARSSKGIHLCQRKYTSDILTDSGNLGSTPTKVPMEQNIKLTQSSGQPLSDLSVYRRLIGRLLYLTITRPDICDSVQTLSQFMAAPTDIHLCVAQKILKYLKAAPSQELLLPSSSSLQLIAFCDSIGPPDLTPDAQSLGTASSLVHH